MKAKRKDKFETPSGREVPPYLAPQDLPPLPYEKAINHPGKYPYVRGIYPEMYRQRLWTMRQYAGFSTPEESNRRYRYLLQHGQTGLSVAFDLPTQIGYDSDHPIARGEVGRVGVAIDTLKDMEILFDGIPLDQVSTSMTINATACILLAMYLVLAEKQKVSWKNLRGTVQNDILKEYIARGTYTLPPEPSMKLVTDLITFCAREVPQWYPISISGYHIREAGATAVQELAFTFANAITYIRETLKQGLAIDAFAPRLSFFFNAHNHFFEEVAKFRAARKVWAKIIREWFHAQNPKSWQLRFHTQTAGSALTAQQPLNNIVRVTLQALAAVAGGTQSLHTNAYDEALALPTDESAKLALRTQQIIAHESGFADTVDPLAGSYLIEAWTHRMAEEVEGEIQKIETLGGSLEAIKKGYMQRAIQDSAYRFHQGTEKGQFSIVGINIHQEEATHSIPLFQLNREKEKQKIQALKEYKKKRDQQKVEKALKALQRGAQKGENLMPFVIDAVKAEATLGEIMQALREIYGEFRDPAFL